ncbi:Protein unc-13-like protein [Dioscorea alata]|uniref:Protein unc-13-like protein n=1 Tax=Dioscorea alata TaxID=55571 RepID=A0ACB7UGY8_DIOAL|nr:Protein unc-13-like protein [Dioscorea alata]
MPVCFFHPIQSNPIQSNIGTVLCSLFFLEDFYRTPCVLLSFTSAAMDASRLLHLYRHDRRKLLEFVLSSATAGTSSDSALDLSPVDLDTLSIDYVLDRVQSGGALDFSEGKKQFFDEMKFPVMLKSSPRSTFFLISNMNMSGSPPQQIAPQILSNVTYDRPSCLSKQSNPYTGPEIGQYGVETGSGIAAAKVAQVQLGKDANLPSLGLPALRTGLSDDDVRETAYEILLASLFLSGVLVHFSEERKRSRHLKGLRSKRDVSNHRFLPTDSYSELLDVIRVQMEISESKDALIKQGLRGFCSGTTNENVDVPQIALELLTTISKSDFSNEKAYTHWHKRQVNTLEELLLGSHGFVTEQKLSSFFSELKNIRAWVSNNSSAGHAEVLTAIRRFASSLSSKPGKFGIPSETYYWTESYHLNLRLYEKLLSSVFDVLDDGQIIEVAEEIISIFKLAWPTLGITKKIHDILYCWVLFQQFTRTGVVTLLELAFFEIHKVASRSGGDVNEEAYFRSLICSAEVYCYKKKMSLVDAVFFNIKWWCGNQLEDYHLHFNEDNSAIYERMMTLATFVEEYLADECRDNECSKLMDATEAASKLVQSFVEKSIQAAYRRVLDLLHIKSKTEQKHPLAILANELKLIVEKDANVFIPILSQHFPQVRIHSSRILHQLYGEQLRPFLEGVTHLSEGAISVLAAATSLERSLTKILGSMCGDGVESLCSNHLQPYQIKDVCLPLILHWVNTQHDNILEWTKRAIHMEEGLGAFVISTKTSCICC